MKNLRNYLPINQLADYIDVESIDNTALVNAERDIDNLCALFYQGINRPAVYYPYFVNNLSINNNQATTSEVLSPSGYFSLTVLEVLSGTNKGLRIFIDDSNLSNNQTILSFSDVNINETGLKAKLHQVAKFPRVADTSIIDGGYQKTIPEFLKEAVAYQYEFRSNNPDSFNNVNQLKSYSVDKESFSETFDTTSKKATDIEDLIAPATRSILDKQGLTVQNL